MVTTSQLQIFQSPITCLLPTVSTAVTVKLDDTNYLIWNFQMQILLESHGILRFVDELESVQIDLMQILTLKVLKQMIIRRSKMLETIFLQQGFILKMMIL
jgi:hypothetical protein